MFTSFRKLSNAKILDQAQSWHPSEGHRSRIHETDGYLLNSFEHALPLLGGDLAEGLGNLQGQHEVDATSLNDKFSAPEGSFTFTYAQGYFCFKNWYFHFCFVLFIWYLCSKKRARNVYCTAHAMQHLTVPWFHGATHNCNPTPVVVPYMVGKGLCHFVLGGLAALPASDVGITHEITRADKRIFCQFNDIERP